VIIFKNENIEELLTKLYRPLKKKNDKKKKVIIIAGPTGVGKTSLSISIAKILNAEIISADSMQVYRGMDIGSAKATKDEQQQIKHHLIDIKDVAEDFNVFEYYRKAHRSCREILIKDKVPIVVGGSGFYIHAFIYGPPLGPPKDPIIRKQLEQQLKEMGPEVLYERLQMLDYEYAKTITSKDKHKIIRALEIILITKNKVSAIPKPKIDQNPVYNYRLWFLYLPKDILYQKVNERCDEMIKKGFIEEVRKLKEMGLEKNYSAAQSIGYRQCLKYLNSKQTLENRNEFINEFKKASRKYVKRQFTWFKKEINFRYLNLHEIGFEKAKEYILQDYEQSI